MQSIQSFFQNYFLDRGNDFDQNNSSPALSVVSLGLTALAVGAAAWCLCYKRNKPIKAMSILETPLQAMPNIAKQESQAVNKREISETKEESPVKTSKVFQELSRAKEVLNRPARGRPMQGGFPHEASILSCGPENSKLYHRMATTVFSKANLDNKEGQIKLHAFQAVNNFINESSYSLTNYFRTVFCDLFSGANFDGILSPNSPVVNPTHLAFVLNNKRLDTGSNQTVIGYMSQKFSDMQIAGSLFSFLLPLELFSKEAIVTLFKEWEKNPAYIDRLLSCDTPEERRFELEKHLLEAIRLKSPVRSTQHPKEVNLAEFAHNEELVGPDSLTFDPERFNDEERFPRSCLSNWNRAPWLPFSHGPNRCLGTSFLHRASVIFLETLLDNAVPVIKTTESEENGEKVSHHSLTWKLRD